MNHDPSIGTGIARPSSAPVLPAFRTALPISAHTQPFPRLLWVDDSWMLLSLYQSVFESLGFEVLATSSSAEALDHLSPHAVDVAILDYDMPEMDGGTLASIIKDRCPALPVILYSGSDSIPPNACQWVDAVCAKAAPRAELLATIDRLLQNASHRQENDHPRNFAPSSNH